MGNIIDLVAMNINAIIKAVLMPQDDAVVRTLRQLNIGDLLTGKVLKVENDGRALMDLAGNRALAQIDFPVKPGQRLHLKVVDTGSVIHLKAAAEPSSTKVAIPFPKSDLSQAITPQDQNKFIQITDRLSAPSNGLSLKNAIPKSVKIALNQIKGAFEPLPMDRPPEKISQWVKSIVEDNGMLFEKRLADMGTAHLHQNHSGEADQLKSQIPIAIRRDVKFQLMWLKRYLANSSDSEPIIEKLGSKALAFLRHSVDRMLGHIEQQQNQAVNRWADGEGQQVFVHTLPLPDQSRPVQIKLFYPRNADRKGNQQQHRIALLLDMDQLGPVRVDMAMIDRYLKISFFVRHSDVQKRLELQAEDMEKSLTGLFDQVVIEVYVSDKKIADFDKEDSKQTDTGRINISV